MRLGDLKKGAFFLFVEEAPPYGCSPAPFNELQQIQIERVNEEWDDAVRCIQLTGEDSGEVDWFPSRGVRQVFPCKACRDQIVSRKASPCACWLKE